jgi:hypothetical protein
MNHQATTNAEPKRSFARTGKYEVLLAGRATCPHCTRLLHASDVTADFGDVTLVCGGCHKDVLVIRGVT